VAHHGSQGALPASRQEATHEDRRPRRYIASAHRSVTHAGSRHKQVDQRVDQRPQAVHLNQDRRDETLEILAAYRGLITDAGLERINRSHPYLAQRAHQLVFPNVKDIAGTRQDE
jgi:hypothetical protein